METKVIPVVDIQVKDNEKVKILLLGDVHYGHESCAFNEFKETLKYAREHNVYIITMGDLLEISVEGHIQGSMNSQTIIPSKQKEDMIRFLYLLKHKILGMITGNHEVSRGWNLNSLDPTEDMASQLGVPFWKDGGYIIVNLKKGRKILQKYVFVLFHGIGESQTPHYLIEKARSNYSLSDLIGMGHTHVLANGSTYVLEANINNSENRRKIVWVRTGGYLNNARYSSLKFYPISAIGSPIIILESKKKAIYVNMLEYD